MNKQESRLEYQSRIQKALTYIRENLDKPLSVKEVAKTACFSEYHFHRIFAAIMQETPGEYITRKKLERAAIRLAYSPGSKVSNVALEFGYSSVSSFSKAFKQWFGCRPTELSKIKQSLDAANGKLQTKYEKLINSDQLYVGPPQEDWPQKFEEIDTHVRIKSISRFELYYLTNPGGYEFSSICRTWNELIERVEDAKISIDDCEKFAISHDHPALTPSLHCRYDACIALPQNRDVELSLAKVVIPSGRYAIFPVVLPAGDFLSWLHHTRRALLIENGTDVDCGECIACCSSSHFVHIRPEETRTLGRIHKNLLVAAPGLPKGHVLLGYDKKGFCPLLINGRCSIYEHRPLTCRNYDCRVFTAAGIAAGDDDKARITQRVRRWKFSYPAKRDYDEHVAVQAATKFIREHAECFPGGIIPSNPGQLAILAIKVSDVFLREDGGSAKTGRASLDAETANAIVEACRKFDARRPASAL